MKIFLLLPLYSALLSNEIPNHLNELQNIEIKVEIININIDLADSTYTWNSIQKSTLSHQNISITYLPSNLSSTYSREAWLYLNSNQSLSSFPKPAWKTFQILLLHSTTFDLKQSFQFRELSDSCECSKPETESYGKSIFIKAHPLESIGLITLHDIFLEFLEKHKFFNMVTRFRETLIRTEELLKPIIVSDEDTNALFFHNNEKFEAEYDKFIKYLNAIKIIMQDMQQGKFWEMSQNALSLIRFDYWIEEIPDKSPSMVVPFVVTLTVFGFFLLLLEILYFKSKSYKLD